MVRIRLRRVGRRSRPSYRIVVTEARSPRDGAYMDLVGTYNPLTDPPTIRLNEEKAREWLRRGAQPSGPVARILRKLAILEKAASDERAG
jgi:small subunit ribosomal protein S16